MPGSVLKEKKTFGQAALVWPIPHAVLVIHTWDSTAQHTRCQLLSALCQIDPTWATWGKQDLFGSKVSESFQSTVLGSLHSELIGKVLWSWQREHVAEATHLVTGGKQREEIQDRAGQDIVFHKHPPLLPTSSTKSLPPVFHRVPAAPSYWKSIRGLPIA